MTTLPSKSATLVITAADDATEIFIIDASLRRIAAGSGQLEEKVSPGIYKVRLRSGSSQHDQIVEVSSHNERVTVQGPPVLFHSAAPLNDTLTTHEYQSGPAAQASRSINMKLGSGGGLFVFVREEDENQTFSTGGLTVHALDGTKLAALEDGDINHQARWGGLNISLDPGTYSIRVPFGRVGAYEIFATVSQDWQTQVFLVFDEFWSEGESFRAPSLSSASVLMSHLGHGFDPYSNLARLTELAQQALAQGRNVISSRLMSELLSGKFEDPMLGILAAHLIMNKHRPDRELLRVVRDNLVDMLGDHPDVKALLIGMKNQSELRVDSIDQPPSLRQSWDYIVKASRRRATLVPPDSPVARIANEVVTGGPWLIHRINEEYLYSLMERPTIAEAVRVAEKFVSIEPKRFSEMIKQTRSGMQNLSGLELGVLSAVKSYKQGLSMESDAKQTRQQVNTLQMFSDISAPSYSIATAVISLADKMKLG
jgi:hypothetical protein